MKKLETLIPPPVYVFFFLTCIYLVNRYVLAGSIEHSYVYFAGVVLMAIGLCYGAYAFISFALSKTTADPTNPNRTVALVTGGVYRISRNPMYVAMAAILIGFSLSLGNVVTLVFPLVFILIINRFQIKPEERVMEEKFADHYRAYKKSVRRWL